MALVYLDNDSDPWLGQEERCERVCREIIEELNRRNKHAKSSESYASISASIRIRMKQLSGELEELKGKLDSSYTLTFEEAERRQRLLENLQSKNVQLIQRLNERGSFSTERRHLFDSSPGWPLDDQDVNTPLLTDHRELTVEELKHQQQRMISEQDRGLDNLSSIIKRQKDIAVTIGDEVIIQNDLVDDISDRMERTNTRILRETAEVQIVGTRENTCTYWTVIILLFIAIITVALIRV